MISGSPHDVPIDQCRRNPSYLTLYDGDTTSNLLQLEGSRTCEYRDFGRPVNTQAVPKEVTLGRRLGPALTCRRMYADVLPFLYSQTTFHFSRPEVFRAFANTVRPELLSFIRCLSLTLEGDPRLFDPCFGGSESVYQHWHGIWETIRNRLTGLRELGLLIYTWNTRGNYPIRPLVEVKGERLPNWISAMLLVRGLTVCEISFANYGPRGIHWINQDTELEYYQLSLQEAMKRQRED